MTTIKIIRPFIFTIKNAAGHPTEIHFRPGEQAVADDVADHPFIRDHFADGCIERPGAPLPSPPSAHATMTRKRVMCGITALQNHSGKV